MTHIASRGFLDEGKPKQLSIPAPDEILQSHFYVLCIVPKWYDKNLVKALKKLNTQTLSQKM